MIDAKNIKGTVVQTGAFGQSQTPIRMAFTGRWLAAECGEHGEERRIQLNEKDQERLTSVLESR